MWLGIYSQGFRCRFWQWGRFCTQHRRGGLGLPRLRGKRVVFIRQGRAAAEVSREPCGAGGVLGVVWFVAVVRLLLGLSLVQVLSALPQFCGCWGFITAGLRGELSFGPPLG